MELGWVFYRTVTDLKIAQALPDVKTQSLDHVRNPKHDRSTTENLPRT